MGGESLSFAMDSKLLGNGVIAAGNRAVAVLPSTSNHPTRTLYALGGSKLPCNCERSAGRGLCRRSALNSITMEFPAWLLNGPPTSRD